MKKDNKKVIYWLLLGCTLIFIMVIVGGITRLTHSGLSMSNYKLISGTIPPMNEVEWQEAFDLYKQYPEYQKLNYHFDLEDFKQIYFWEWIHRVIGRLIGLVFIIPFLYFLITKQLSKPTIKKSIILLFMGGFQGFLGWYMVKSGLVDRPDVSHYRLAMHLTTAFLTFAYTFWVALDLIFPQKKEVNTKMRNFIRLGFVVLILQIIYGAFVAGLDAGFIHNHWPLMSDGKFMHETVYIEQDPLYLNFIEGKSGVQFVHRTLAYVVVALIIAIWYRMRRLIITKYQLIGVNTLLVGVGIQFLLGVLTIIYAVPVWLGVVHQVGAFLLLSAMVFTLHRFSK
ncbi:COX15/CtaA family protein [Psychroserpens sp.]|uniref:COX15/CtaA family protein n=1 Tax=Psychroserpens sp. TaxID=2020870 RepID=UPI001B2D556C|nr:COX15/CtaA family protein [Psychroserpens sp.]MBO6607170.1 COX15/CtaA family protein [Psychroserpens sp.]MBO6631753.1 COX15/CtaA family protein [Psychroserpens sp.]MBO6654316.1 COX15/CtaA family protein [Psychroserpens sp.]MBO6682398.1 COX15/CtaA family protein [Psychroserpens sp.]MBO6750942.1 COX15/CtaA family protein [Psychroserpens sp.]